MDLITQTDFNILYFIRDNMSCDFLDFIMPKITLLGDYGVVWIATAIILLVIKKYRKTGIAVSAALIMSLLIGNLLLKNLVARDRPCWIDTSVSLLIAVPTDFSFPSGHSMASFAAAVVIFRYHRKAGIAALILAAVIAFSRLYLFVHFPTDVLVGSITGAGLAVAAFIITDKMMNRIKEHSQNKA